MTQKVTPPSDREQPVVAEDADAERGSVRVLVADDDEWSACIVKHRLEMEGFEVVCYADGQDAYEAALADTPDLVILDVKMPSLGGFEVLELLRRDPRHATTPIIMLTAMVREADVVRGFRLGADAYVRKPFSPEELCARVRRLIGSDGIPRRRDHRTGPAALRGK